ncbi:hypothetical protein [Campylobacter sp. VTCC 70190]
MGGGSCGGGGYSFLEFKIIILRQAIAQISSFIYPSSVVTI